MSMISRTIHCCAAISIIAVVAAGQERRPDPVGDQTGRDAVGFRKDSVTKETLGDRRAPANTPTTKQAIEDFMQIQKINRQIQDLAKQTPLALDRIATSSKDLRARANRLKTSLSLPSPPKEAVRTGTSPSESTDELLKRIDELDVNIRAFVTNPIFRQINDTGKDWALEASVRLGKVLSLSKVLEESANRLHK